MKGPFYLLSKISGETYQAAFMTTEPPPFGLGSNHASFYLDRWYYIDSEGNLCAAKSKEALWVKLNPDSVAILPVAQLDQYLVTTTDINGVVKGNPCTVLPKQCFTLQELAG